MAGGTRPRKDLCRTSLILLQADDHEQVVMVSAFNREQPSQARNAGKEGNSLALLPVDAGRPERARPEMTGNLEQAAGAAPHERPAVAPDIDREAVEQGAVLGQGGAVLVVESALRPAVLRAEDDPGGVMRGEMDYAREVQGPKRIGGGGGNLPELLDPAAARRGQKLRVGETHPAGGSAQKPRGLGPKAAGRELGRESGILGNGRGVRDRGIRSRSAPRPPRCPRKGGRGGRGGGRLRGGSKDHGVDPAALDEAKPERSENIAKNEMVVLARIREAGMRGKGALDIVVHDERAAEGRAAVEGAEPAVKVDVGLI